MTKFYFYYATDNNKTLVVATSKAYFDEHARIDEGETDSYVDFYRAVAAKGFSEIFPPVYQKDGDDNLIGFLDAMARAGFSLCESPKFTKAAKKLIIEGPSS